MIVNLFYTLLIVYKIIDVVNIFIKKYLIAIFSENTFYNNNKQKSYSLYFINYNFTQLNKK